MDPFQHGAAILGHAEHVAEVHHVVTFGRLPLQHVGLDEVEATRMAVAVARASPLDLPRAHLHTGDAATETGRDVRAGIAHPGAELEYTMLRSKARVGAHVIEQSRAA